MGAFCRFANRYPSLGLAVFIFGSALIVKYAPALVVCLA
jgi:hypothetical protein